MNKKTLARHTADGQNPANQLIGSLSHYLQGLIHPRRSAGFLPSTVLGIIYLGDTLPAAVQQGFY